LVYESYKMVPTGTLIFKNHRAILIENGVSTKNKNLNYKKITRDIIGYWRERAQERINRKLSNKANMKRQEQERLEKEETANI